MTHWTEQQLEDHRRRRGIVDVPAPPFQLPANEPGAFALGRLPTGTMNKTEALYDAHLSLRRQQGGIIWHKFEAIKLRLADNTFYTADFFVLPADRELEIHEVKGFMMDDANVKIKVAASIYPFRFKIVRKGKGGIWDITEVSR